MSEVSIQVANVNKNKKKKVFTKSNIILYIMFLPVLLSYIIFSYLPMPGLYIAFADYRISGFKDIWVGLSNFQYIFNLANFWEAFKNTWVFIIYNYIFAFPAPIILALLLNELKNNRYKKLIQTVSCLPHFLSWVVIASIWISILSPSTGYVNYIIRALGGEPYYFLSNAKLFPALLTFIRIWKDVGYNSIIYLAALSTIDQELYEAAWIDGAGRFKQTMHVTLPGIKSTILVLFVLSFSGILNLFDPVYVFQNPMIASTAETLDTYIYKQGVVQARYSMATAVGLFKSLISFVFVIITNYLSKFLTEDGQSILW